MSQQDQTQNLQAQIIELKSRLFDANEHIAQTQAQAKELGEALTKIVELTGIGENAENGQVRIVDIIKSVEDLVEFKNEQFKVVEDAKTTEAAE